MAQAAYSRNQAQGGTGTPRSDQGAGTSANDDVVDANFEMIKKYIFLNVKV